jgi:high-affinity iron transporter
MPNVFSVPVFFIVFRETLEAVIIVSVLLSVAERITNARLPRDFLPTSEPESGKENITSGVSEVPSPADTSSEDGEWRKLLRKLRIQVCQREPLSSSSLRT